MIKFFAFVCLAVSVFGISNSEYPTLETLDWEAGGSYRATGVSVNRIVTYGDFTLPYTHNLTQMIQTESDASMVLDVTNKRMLLDMGQGGLYYYFHNQSYILIPGNPCGVVDFNYTTQVNEYGRCVQTDEVKDKHNGKVNVYTGLNLDVGSCHRTIGLTMQQDKDGFITKWGWAHEWAVGGVPILVSGSIIFDRIRPICGAVNDSYFELPSECSNPVDYCSQVYPL